jgi:hypothetical protein
MAGVVAGLQTIQALRLLLGDTSVVGRELIVDAQHALLQMATVRRAPRCRFDHHVWPLRALEAGAWFQPVHQLFTRTETELGGPVALQAHHRTLATRLLCSTCGSQHPIATFLHALQAAEMHCPCGGVAQPVGLACLSEFDRAQAAAFLDKTWQQLGLPVREVVTASSADGRHVHYIVAE